MIFRILSLTVKEPLSICNTKLFFISLAADFIVPIVQVSFFLAEVVMLSAKSLPLYKIDGNIRLGATY